MATSPSYDLFVSFANEDSAWVEGYLLDALRAAGVRVHTEAAFALGAPRLTEFERAVEQSARTLLILSPAYVADEVAGFVDVLAQHYGLESGTWPVIPLLLHPVELPPRLKMLVALDATSPERQEAALARLLETVSAPLPEPAARPPCPYPGMRPFTTAQASLFFGRDAEIVEAVDALARHPFLTVIGPSGSGKSSLVFAGIIPALEKSSRFGAGSWLVATMRPGKTPLVALRETLAGLAEARGPALLVVDQFEETFTLAGEGADAFLEELPRVVARGEIHVVLTVRADFYPALMAEPALWNAIRHHRLEVTPLGERELRVAIVGPAEHAGVYVEAALVERLAADAAGEPGVLPMVQETLVLLWDHLERRFLPLRAYEQLILPRGTYSEGVRSGLQVAMARHADYVYNQLPGPARPLARRVFLRLIQFGEGRADTRRQLPVEELRADGDDPALLDATIRTLTDNRLLTTSAEIEGPANEQGASAGDEAARATRMVDISHEALIEGWPRLQKWLSEWRAAERTRRRLEGHVSNYERITQEGGQQGGLLDPIELAEAEAWLASPEASEMGVINKLSELVTRSREVINRREHELSRRNRIITFFGIGAMGLAILAFALFGRASDQQARAEAASTQAVSQQSIAEAASTRAIVQQREAEAASTRAIEKENEALAAEATAVAEAKRTRAQAQAAEALRVLALPNQDRASLLAMAAVYPLSTEAVPLQAARARMAVVGQTRPRAVLKGHTEDVTSVAWDPLGERLLTGSDDGTARVWDATTGAELARLQGHEDSVRSVAWDPSGERVLTAGDDGTSRVWDATTGAELVRLEGSTDTVRSVAWSPNGERVLTASVFGTVWVWNVTTGAELAELKGHTGNVLSVAWDPSGERLVTGGQDYTVRMWDALTGVEIARLEGHTELVTAVAWHSSGERLVTASRDGTAWVGEVATGTQLARLEGHTFQINSVAWDPSGERLLTGSRDHTARVWEVTASVEVATLRHTDDIFSVGWDPLGERVLTGSADGRARVWDTATGAELVRLDVPFAVGVLVAWDPSGERVLTGSSGPAVAHGTAQVWEAATGAELARLEGHTGPIRSVAWDPSGNRVVTGSRDYTARVWDAATGAELARLEGRAASVRSVAWDPLGERVLTESLDGTVRVWDAADGEQLVVLDHKAYVHSMAWDPLGDRVLTGSDDGTARVWDAATGAELVRLEGHTERVSAVAWDPSGERVLTASGDRTARVWDAATGTELVRLEGHTERVSAVAWDPSGERVLTASGDRTTRVWDAGTGTELARLEGHAEGVSAVAWDPSGERVLTASGDRTARVWIVSPRLLNSALINLTCALHDDEVIRGEVADWRGCDVELAAVTEDLAEYHRLTGARRLAPTGQGQTR